MKLYLISQSRNDGYDTYDSAVVCAPDEETARNMNPGGGGQVDWSPESVNCSTWCYKPEQVKVEYLGETEYSKTPTIVSSSFNAG